MSLVLTALRLQAIAALNSHPAIAELCGGRVYDSRIGDFDHREPVPVIVVTTEEVEGEQYSQNGGAPFDDRCNLVLQIAMNTLVDVDGEDALGIPATDGELEAQLNLIAHCADMILTLGRPHPLAAATPQGALLVDAITRRVSKRTIARFSSDDTAERLAIHLVTYLVELKGEDPDALAPPTGAYRALPEPLRLVCEAAAPGSPADITCRMIAGRLAFPALPHLAAARFSPLRPNPLGPDDPDPAAAVFSIPEPE